MAASRSTRVTRSTVGLNGLDENFCGRTLRNRSIAHPEEVSSLPQVRSRSPKKKPDSLQTQKGNNSGRTNDVKQQNSRESWVSPRKRGLSASEKDVVEKQTVESCEKKQVEPVSPVVKRNKRCLRSETQNSSEEVLPSKTGKERLERKSSVSDNVAVTPGPKRACRCLILDDSDKREVKRVNACAERFNSSSVSEELSGCKSVNGVDGRNSDASRWDDCQSDGSTTRNNADFCSSKEKNVTENGNALAHSSFGLNRSKEDSFVDHSVPCTNSQEQVTLEDHNQLNNCLPEETANQAHGSGTGTGSFSEIQSSLLRNSEEEVDVIGDCSASKKQSENTNNNLDSCQDSTLVSGEPEPSVLDCVPSQIISAPESQEHRYTLRTSPWRVCPTKGSPTKHNSPYRENGHIEESNHSIPEKNVESGITIINQSIKTDIIPNEKERGCDSGDNIDEGLSRPPSEARFVIGSLPSAKESANLHAIEDEEEEPDVYFFESDHVALKHNKDYQRLLQTIAVLEAQRTQAVQDLESLGRHQREALKDPIGFVESLQKKVDVGLPNPQRVVKLPEISWDQYTTSLGNFEREFKNRKRNSRRAKLIFDKGLPTRPKSPLDPRKDGEPTSYSVLPFSDCLEASANNRPQMIRGRLCDETKPESFNQLWTVEEQKKLEQLLLKYPPEEVESRRWQKIADELGNRTAKQVASRVQKYFIKLTKAGIPVPGRTPNLYLYSKKSSNRRQHPLNKHLFKPSTFMTSHEPPVYMDEDDDRSSFHSHMATAAEEEPSDDESIPVAYRELPEYKELLKLKKLKKQKLQLMHAESGFIQHVGFKCDNCGTDPIQGIRWHCQDCPPEMSLDFCDSCSDCLHETEIHKENHRLEPVYRAEMFFDRDYCMSQGPSYNYLDPNYFPANR